MTRTKLVLFDIDGTLLTAGYATRRAISRALKEVFQVDDALKGLSRASFAGKTDPEIILSILARNDFQGNDVQGKLVVFFTRYIEALKEELPGEPEARLHPGVRELLRELDSSKRAVLGLLTGNIHEGAMIKLRNFGLDGFFTTGSFGSDSANRGDLPKIAMRRASHKTGKKFEGRSVIIVGDTPDDCEISRQVGAKSVLVATGFYPYEELARVKPDHLFRDFTDTAEVIKAILS
ncbi:MAG: HAD family hydrolase [Candidatus Glassbacteria bacterium]